MERTKRRNKSRIMAALAIVLAVLCGGMLMRTQAGAAAVTLDRAQDINGNIVYYSSINESTATAHWESVGVGVGKYITQGTESIKEMIGGFNAPEKIVLYYKAGEADTGAFTAGLQSVVTGANVILEVYADIENLKQKLGDGAENILFCIAGRDTFFNQELYAYVKSMRIPNVHYRFAFLCEKATNVTPLDSYIKNCPIGYIARDGVGGGGSVNPPTENFVIRFTFYNAEGVTVTNTSPCASGVKPTAPTVPERVYVKAGDAIEGVWKVFTGWDKAITAASANITYIAQYRDVIGELPADPVQEGHTFRGWYLDQAFTQPYAGQDITDDLTLYAKFEINRYTVTYDAAGGTACDPVILDWNARLSTIPNPTREGYNFLGWFLADGTQYTDQTIKEDTTLMAHWEIKTFTVTFMVNDQVYKTLTVEYGCSLRAAAEEAKLIYYNLYDANGSALDKNAQITDAATVIATEMSRAEKVGTFLARQWWILVAAGCLIGVLTLALVVTIIIIKRG